MFHDERLPIDVERGAVGGPSFSTSVTVLSSGFEQRNINWANSRGSWDIGYGIESKEDFTDVLEFFYARQGRAHSFRFRDWSDYTIGDDAEDDPQTIATGDGATVAFQVIKTYVSGATTFSSTITKLVSGTVRVFVNGVEKTITAQWTVNLLTGLITFTGGNTPPNGHLVAVIAEFDVPARFDSDKMAVNMAVYNAGSIPSIPVVEVRGE